KTKTMASRALFKSNVLASLKRSGVRFQSNATVSEFAVQRDAVKKHAAGEHT
ncbi:hypothetical protein EC973_004476, partial [Apophysomyces ossiformis]